MGAAENIKNKSSNTNVSNNTNVSKQQDQKIQEDLTDKSINVDNKTTDANQDNTSDGLGLDLYEQDSESTTELEKKVRAILNEHKLNSASGVDERLGDRFNGDINTFFKSERLASVPAELYNSPTSLNKFACLISEALVNKNAKDSKLLNPNDQAKLRQVAKSLRVNAYKAQTEHDYAENFDHTQDERCNYLVIDTRGQDTHKLALGKNKQFELYRDDHHKGGFSLRFPQGKFHKKALAEAIMLEAGYRPHGTLKNLSNDKLTSVLDQLIEDGVDISRLKVEGSPQQHAILKRKQVEQADFQEKVIKQINNEEIHKGHGVENLTYSAYKVKSEAERRLHAEHLPQPVIEKFMQELVKEINNEIK